MYRYLSNPHWLLRRHQSGVLSFLQNHAFSVEARPESSKKSYDLSTYQFQYTPEEKETIMTVLNQSSEEELSQLRLTKGIVKKLIKSRARIGTFQNISQLLDIDGFGLKSIESICEKALQEIPSCTSEENELQSKTLFYKKRLVKPRVEPHVLRNLETILAVDITIGSLSWTMLNQYGEILDMNTEDLVSKTERLDAPKLYDKIVTVAKNIPRADVYVWEERANYGHLQRAPLGSIMVAIKLAQIRGILTALLDAREEGQEEGRLFYLRDLLVSKLFNLKVGEERISGLSLADGLMSCERVLDWLPPLIMDEETQEKYFSIDKDQRKRISTSLFVGLAFQQTVVENSVYAHKILID